MVVAVQSEELWGRVEEQKVRPMVKGEQEQDRPSAARWDNLDSHQRAQMGENRKRKRAEEGE